MPKHLALANLTAAHFVRWLGLFRKTVEEICSPDAAASLHRPVRAPPCSFRIGIAMHRGEDCLGIGVLRAPAR